MGRPRLRESDRSASRHGPLQNRNFGIQRRARRARRNVREAALEYLVCPICRGTLRLQSDRIDDFGIAEGELHCEACAVAYSIRGGIPRFVASESYSSSFGEQWIRAGSLRSDSQTGTTYMRDTVLGRTEWPENHLDGKLVLECGCGAGDDTDVLQSLGNSTLISLDLSASVKVAYENTKSNPNVHIIQADLSRIPLREKSVDVVYCHRVLQHTPDPETSFFSMTKHLKDRGGEMFLHCYDSHLSSVLHWKYALRPITKRIDSQRLFRILETLGPALYRLAGAFSRLPLKIGHVSLGRVFAQLFIPFYNHDDLSDRYPLSPEFLYQLSLVNTFDALSPQHDHPKSPSQLRRWFVRDGFDRIELRGRNPVRMVATR